MALSVRILIAMIALTWILAGAAQPALALGKHNANQLKALRHSKKNTSPYAYLAPRKQKKTTWYRSPVTGAMVPGTKKK